jgi:hypothetical protein
MNDISSCFDNESCSNFIRDDIGKDHTFDWGVVLSLAKMAIVHLQMIVYASTNDDDVDSYCKRYHLSTIVRLLFDGLINLDLSFGSQHSRWTLGMVCCRKQCWSEVLIYCCYCGIVREMHRVQ